MIRMECMNVNTRNVDKPQEVLQTLFPYILVYCLIGWVIGNRDSKEILKNVYELL